MAITTEQQQQIKLENHDGVYSYTIVDLVQKTVEVFLVENLEAHEVLVEQILAQLLVHNPNECGSDWAAVVEE